MAKLTGKEILGLILIFLGELLSHIPELTHLLFPFAIAGSWAGGLYLFFKK